MAAKEKGPGVFARGARAARRVGGFYLWTVTGDLKERKDDFKRIKARVDGILNRKFRHETFDDAIARLALTDDDLNGRADYLASLAFLFGLIAVLSLMFLLATPWSPSPANHAAMSFGVACLSGSKYLATRFRVAQIRQRQFFEFKDWILRRTGGR